jgi:hypothetical protein
MSNLGFEEQAEEDLTSMRQNLAKPEKTEDTVEKVGLGLFGLSVGASFTIICLSLFFLAYYHQEILSWVWSVFGG